MRAKRFILILILNLTLGHLLVAQQVNVLGGFLKDSVRIGDDIPYFLIARYPSDQTVLFPDSTFNFTPFELTSKKYFTTQTINGESYDSVVYHLSTFEIDNIQRLQLPVFKVAAKDCTTFLPAWDTIYLQELVTTPPPDTLQPQNLPLKVNTAYEQVSYLFNYPILLTIGGSLLLIALLVWILFGKRIRRHYRIKKLEKNHRSFLRNFNSGIDEVAKLFTPQHTESTLFIWKKYLEQLERKPYTKLTTRETVLKENDELLGKSLGKIDRAIYGHDTAVVESFENLRSFAENRFNKKLEEVKHG